MFKKRIEPKYKVSVILPNYNYAKYLKKRVKGIEKQTYPVYELILLDDDSSDNSVSIIEKIKFKYQIKKVINDKNSGSVFNQWKKGIELATGDLIWIAEADDLADSKFRENVVAKFDHPNTILSFSDSKRIDQNGKIIGKTYSEIADEKNSGRYKKDYVNDGIEEIKNYLVVKNYIYNASGVVFRNGDYSEILEKCKKFKLAGDWYMYLQILKKGNVAYTAKPLNLHRIHTNSVTKVTKAMDHYNEVVSIQEEIMKEYKISKEVKKDIEDQRKKLKIALGISDR